MFYKFLVEFILQTNGYFAIRKTYKESYRKKNSYEWVENLVPKVSVINKGDNDIQECNLVLCENSNLFLRGYNKTNAQWKNLWQIDSALKTC